MRHNELGRVSRETVGNGRVGEPSDRPDRVSPWRLGSEAGIAEGRSEAYLDALETCRKLGRVREVPPPGPTPLLPTWALWALVAAFLGGLFLLRWSLDGIVLGQ